MGLLKKNIFGQYLFIKKWIIPGVTIHASDNCDTSIAIAYGDNTRVFNS